MYVSSLAPEPLGNVTLSADRRFQISAVSLEKKSWQAGRLVILVRDQQGRQAEGFVSVASFADISKRAGIVARRLMAVLNGTETPADVAAIMSWFYEDPNRLADAAGPQATGGGGKDGAAPKTAEDVVVADLSRTGMAAAAAQAAGKGANANWSRFRNRSLPRSGRSGDPLGGQVPAVFRAVGLRCRRLTGFTPLSLSRRRAALSARRDHNGCWRIQKCVSKCEQKRSKLLKIW